MKKVIQILVIALLLTIGGVLIFRSCRANDPTPKIFLSASSDIREIVRVTSLEGEQVAPVTYHKGSVSAIGVGYYHTRIYFDVEEMEQVIIGDTLYLRLPKPQIQILENQEQGFKVMDVWGETIFARLKGPSLTVEDENEMKAQAMNNLRAELRADGSLDKAKSQATKMILNMFSLIPGTVIILDYTDSLPPNGQPIDKNIPLE